MSIAQLDLSHNKFSDKGCRQIAQAMQEAGAHIDETMSILKMNYLVYG